MRRNQGRKGGDGAAARQIAPPIWPASARFGGGRRPWPGGLSFGQHRCRFKRIGLEAGPLSQWLFSRLLTPLLSRLGMAFAVCEQRRENGDSQGSTCSLR